MNNAWDAFWSNTKISGGMGLQDHYAQMWQHVANYFKDDANISGYDVMNEPWPGSGWMATVFGSSHFEAEKLTPFYNQVISAIRSVDDATPVYVEPQFMFGMGLPTHLGAMDDDNTLFSFHDYCVQTVILGTDFLCGLVITNTLNNAESYMAAHNIPGLVTEFGNNPIGLQQAVDIINQHGLGWQKWEYTALNDPATSGPGSLVNNPMSHWTPRATSTTTCSKRPRSPTRRRLRGHPERGRSTTAYSPSPTPPTWSAAKEASRPDP